MHISTREKLLSWVLLWTGIVCLFGLLPLTRLFPDGWMWQPRQAEYEQMILAIYAVLGIFLIRASRHPRDHRSLIAFTAWSSLAHGGVMLVQALRDASERTHLFADVPALLIVGVAILYLSPRRDEVSTPL